MTQTLHPTSGELKTLVLDELGWIPQVDADDIGVSVVDGAVTLSGEVASYHEKAAAVRAVLRLRGVTAVADGIVVTHPAGVRPDADLARDVAVVLGQQPGAQDVKAEVVRRWITLTGTTGWDYERLAATRAVEHVPGVGGVSNRITIAPVAPFSAAQAEARISAALQRNAALDAKHVHVTTKGHTIELTGRVSSWAEQRQAGYAAYATPGVTHVDNLLRVVP